MCWLLIILFVLVLLYMKIFFNKQIEKLNNEIKNLKNYDSSTFSSKQQELIFYLTQLEGKQRNKLLGIKDEYYEDKKLAQRWYRNIAKYVHPDQGGSSEAFNTLNKIYEILIEDDES